MNIIHIKEIEEILLNNSLTPDYKDVKIYNFLTEAIDENKLDLIKYIIDKHDLNISYGSLDIIQILIKDEKIEIFDYMINHIISSDILYILNVTILHYLKNKNKNSLKLYEIAVKYTGYQKSFIYLLNYIFLKDIIDLLPYLIYNGCDINLIEKVDIKYKLNILLRKNKLKNI